MNIVTLPDPVLRAKAQNIVVPVIERQSYENIIESMVDTLRALHAVGLAAPQVGLPLRLVVMDPFLTGAPFVMLNPIRNGLGVEFKWGVEGCLSCPGQKYRVRRRKAIGIEWRDLDGRPHSKRLDGWAARVAQHELDHLEGELISDHGRPVRKTK